MDNPIQAWWKAFQEKTGDLDDLFHRRSQWDLPGWMAETLQAIHSELMWEYGPAVHGDGHRLVITTEGRRYLRPLVTSILRQAPELPGWEFYGYRLPESYEMAVLTVDARTGGEIDRTLVQAEVDELNRIDLVFAGPNYSDDEDRAFYDVCTATESLLGEETMERWIGAIDVESLPTGDQSSWVSIRELPQLVESFQQQIRDSLPDQPYWAFNDDAEWALFRLEPDDAEDYPAQSDIFVGRTMIPGMWKNAHSPLEFDSVRFSKNGEVFCYVKIDGSQRAGQSILADRSEIEDALDQALRKAQAGCVVGGGAGRRYNYFDLALHDMTRGIDIVKTVLRQSQVPERAWLQFFDTELEARWISIWNDAPAPPMWDFED